jgi:hypothetical protein
VGNFEGIDWSLEWMSLKTNVGSPKTTVQIISFE